MKFKFDRDDRKTSNSKVKELETGKWRLDDWHYDYGSDKCRVVLYLEDNQQYWRDELGKVRL